MTSQPTRVRAPAHVPQPALLLPLARLPAGPLLPHRRRRTATARTSAAPASRRRSTSWSALAAFGTMNAVLSAGARIAAERAVGLEPPAAADAALDARRTSATKVADRLRDGACSTHRCCSTSPAPRSASGCGAGDWVEMTGLHPRRADPVRGARHPARPPRSRPTRSARRSAARPRCSRSSAASGSRSAARRAARRRAGAALVLARPGSARRHRRHRLGTGGWLVVAVWTVALAALVT